MVDPIVAENTVKHFVRSRNLVVLRRADHQRNKYAKLAPDVLFFWCKTYIPTQAMVVRMFELECAQVANAQTALLPLSARPNLKFRFAHYTGSA